MLEQSSRIFIRRHRQTHIDTRAHSASNKVKFTMFKFQKKLNRHLKRQENINHKEEENNKNNIDDRIEDIKIVLL